MGAKWLYSNLSWASAAGTTLAFPPLLSEEGWRRSFRKVYSCREVVTIRKLQIFLKTLFYSIWLNVSMNSQPTRYFFFFFHSQGRAFLSLSLPSSPHHSGSQSFHLCLFLLFFTLPLIDLKGLSDGPSTSTRWARTPGMWRCLNSIRVHQNRLDCSITHKLPSKPTYLSDASPRRECNFFSLCRHNSVVTFVS